MSWLKRIILRMKYNARIDWAWVPPPNIRCSHGKQTNAKYGDYW